MKIFANLILLLAALASANEQNAGQIARIQATPGQDGGVTIAVDVTSTSSPKVFLAMRPDRLVLEIPGAGSGAPQAPIAVEQNGVKSVTLEFDTRVSPPLARIVVALTSPRLYGLSREGTRLVLTVLPQETGDQQRNVPAAAATVPLLGRLHHKQETTPPPTTNEAQAAPAPQPALPPISFPPTQASSTATTVTEASAQPQSSAQAGDTAGSQANTAAAPMATTWVPASEPEAVPTDTTQAATSQQANPDVRIAFRVKYVAEGVAYLDGGKNDGLTEGMKLDVKTIDPTTKPTASKTEDAQPVAELEVSSVALSSAVSEIHNPIRPVKVGDWAYLSASDTQSLIAERSMSATRKYPVVVAFTEGDTLDEEAREVIPRPPLPEINRARGRIGFDYSGVASHGAGGGLSSNAGMVIRTDITRINGTYWNLSGFWRGRLSNRSSAGQTTMQDLINRTYTLGLTYDNPHSNWVAGFGRLYLPWATSLDSMDGGYVGRRLGTGVTAGIFGGTSPDPTSWSYNPDRRLGGAFVNFEGGSFDNLRYTSTAGLGISTLKWTIDRPFIFFENGIFYKHYVSIYHSLQADSPRGNQEVAAPGPGISRSFLTVRVQPTTRVEFDINHSYFRDIPTFDPTLVGTGLLDKYLFQGFSGGVRVQVVKNIWAYTTLGRSSTSSDAKSSWNQLYGVTVERTPWVRVRTDVHYSKFDSAFGSGSYSSISFSRNFSDNLRWEVLGGRQAFISPLVKDTSHFVTGNFEAALGPHYFFQTGYTWNRGPSQNYDQWMFTFGYRFDSREKRK